MRETSRPSVEALIPTFNAERFISQSLASLAAQDYPNLKFLIFDDASTDSTAKICREFVAADERAVLHVQKHNRGWINNINDLLDNAQGELVFIAPHDDVYQPDYVSRLVQALEENTASVLAFSDTDIAHPDGRLDQQRYHQLEGVSGTLRRTTYLLFQCGPWWTPFRGIFRRSALDAGHRLQTSNAGDFSADWPWLTGLALQGQFVRVPEVLCDKRFQTSSVSRNWDFNPRAWIAVTAACARVIKNGPLAWSQKLLLLIVCAATIAWRVFRYLWGRIRKGLLSD